MTKRTDISIYHPAEYFLQRDNIETNPWWSGQLRIGNQYAAIAYAYGIKSFQEVQKIFNICDDGDKVQYGSGILDHLSWIVNKSSRIPRNIVEIGGGRGEVSIALSHLRNNVQMIEPSNAVFDLIKMSIENMKIIPLGPFRVINKPLIDAIQEVDWSNVDTIIMIESIEHIKCGEFEECWPSLQSVLKANRGYLIITNWITYWPIEWGPPYHCWGVDNTVYDWLSKDAITIFRDRSHLVIQF